ncbi:hypothetical protein EJ357_46060 [Streptomyces cyaneochromogenes]|uniref:Uncharacterized protein n=1 Tax=Streptomyces cyaneochromogenes TaxID=2496836 RepID=A0A3S9ML52_9ACTN|nr:hypothetical protein EJ357_46060 [Streptomyces cyaneochromogenes]
MPRVPAAPWHRAHDSGAERQSGGPPAQRLRRRRRRPATRPRATRSARRASPGSPLKHRNLNLLGRYSFTASTPAAGALRPLSDADALELDEDDDGAD